MRARGRFRAGLLATLLAIPVLVSLLALPAAGTAAGRVALAEEVSPSPTPGSDATTGSDASAGTDASGGTTPADPASVIPTDPPPCRYRDLSAVVDPAAPHLTLLDTAVALRRSYAPRDLVPVGRAGLAGVGKVRRAVVADLRALDRAARAAGVRLTSVSAYRSYATQIATFASWRRLVGSDRVRLYSARPGHSEHQLGTTIDFGTFGGPRPWTVRDWARTRAGGWLARHGWEYGWVMTYPRTGSPAVSCYAYEPWHWRWVGREAARAIHEAGVVPRVWLWRRAQEQR